MEILRIRTQRTVSAVVQLVDDFTGRTISDPNLSVTALEIPEKPIWKPDGYYVFLKGVGDCLTVTVRGKCYHEKTVSVDCTQLAPLHPIVCIRLTPNRNYIIPPHTTCLEGIAQPNQELRVLCLNDPRPLRLRQDYPAGAGEIHLFDPRNTDPEGRTFALLRKGEKRPECFTVQSCTPEGGCILAQPFQKACKIAGASVFPVWITQADGEGRFFLPIPKLALSVYHCRIYRKQEKSWTEGNFDLESGKITWLDLRTKEGSL